MGVDISDKARVLLGGHHISRTCFQILHLKLPKHIFIQFVSDCLTQFQMSGKPLNNRVSFIRCCICVFFNIIGDGVSGTFLYRSGFCSGECGGCKVRDRSSREAGVESTELDPSVLIEQGHIVTVVYSTARCRAVSRTVVLAAVF